MKQIKTNHGFALMEVVLASAIAAIISFAMLQLMSTTLDNATTIEDKVNKLYAEELLLQNFVTQPTACMKTVQKGSGRTAIGPVPKFVIDELLDIHGGQLIQTKKEY